MFQQKLVIKFFCLLFIIWFMNGFNPAIAQNLYQNKPLAGLPEFQFDVVNINSHLPERSCLNFYIEIAYDDLQFVKNDSGFTAVYEISIAINSNDEEQVAGSAWHRTLLVKEYETTNSQNLYDFSAASYHVPPGNYEVTIRLVDNDTRQEFIQKMNCTAHNFNKEKLAVSDLTLVSQINTDSAGVKTMTPIISSNIREKLDQLTIYYEIYSQKKVEKFKVVYTLKNNRRKKILENKIEVPRTGPGTKVTLTIDIKQFSMGRYFLDLKVDDGSDSKSLEDNFVLRWHGIPNTIFDLEIAIEQLKYIADGSDIKKMRKAKGKDKETLFENFWAKLDPTPGTTINEYLEEYFRRINFANEAFKGFLEGWKSDMGMVFIVLGEPNDIERHPFEQGAKPYQIWYYYQQDRRFIFIDENGFGDYRLAYGWEDLYRDMRWRP